MAGARGRRWEQIPALMGWEVSMCSLSPQRPALLPLCSHRAIGKPSPMAGTVPRGKHRANTHPLPAVGCSSSAASAHAELLTMGAVSSQGPETWGLTLGGASSHPPLQRRRHWMGAMGSHSSCPVPVAPFLPPWAVNQQGCGCWCTPTHWCPQPPRGVSLLWRVICRRGPTYLRCHFLMLVYGQRFVA